MTYGAAGMNGAAAIKAALMAGRISFTITAASIYPAFPEDPAVRPASAGVLLEVPAARPAGVLLEAPVASPVSAAVSGEATAARPAADLEEATAARPYSTKVLAEGLKAEVKIFIRRAVPVFMVMPGQKAVAAKAAAAKYHAAANSRDLAAYSVETRLVS